MAPLDQRQQRPVAWEGGATAPGQQAKAIVEPRRDLLWRQDPGARRRQLDRQWNPVQPPADLGDGRRVGGGEVKRGVCRRRTLREQPHAIVACQGIYGAWLP